MTPPREPRWMSFTGTERYIATDELQLAVRAAVALQEPLLMTSPAPGRIMVTEEVGGDLTASLTPGRRLQP
jgi:hypothetical protein